MREIKFRQWLSVKKRMADGPAIIKDGHWRGPESVNFESDPLMQFTGLRDSKGVEIYEGDILKSGTSERLFPVTWWAEKAHFRAVKGNIVLDSAKAWKNAEVIGNIWEHPDLISGSRES